MANIRLYGSQSGHIEVAAPQDAADRRLLLPDEDGVLATREYLDESLSASAVAFSGLTLHGAGSGSVTLQPPDGDANASLELPSSGSRLLSDASPLPAENLDGRFGRETLPSGAILQVRQTVFRETFATAVGQGWAAVAPLNCTISPTSPTSQVLVKLDLCFGFHYWHYKVRLTRNGTPVQGAMGSVDGVRQQVWLMMNDQHSSHEASIGGGTYLDSPGSTGPQTYGIEIGGYSTSYWVYINRTHTNYNRTDYDARPVSTLTLMEVAA